MNTDTQTQAENIKLPSEERNYYEEFKVGSLTVSSQVEYTTEKYGPKRLWIRVQGKHREKGWQMEATYYGETDLYGWGSSHYDEDQATEHIEVLNLALRLARLYKENDWKPITTTNPEGLDFKPLRFHDRGDE